MHYHRDVGYVDMRCARADFAIAVVGVCLMLFVACIGFADYIMTAIFAPMILMLMLMCMCSLALLLILWFILLLLLVVELS